MAFLGQEEQIRELQNQFKYVYTLLFLGFSLLICRLVYLQIFKGDQMRHFSEENRIKRVKIPAPRGMIFDRNRNLLVDNRSDFDLEIIPQYLKESKQEKKVISLLSEMIQVPENIIQKEYLKHKNQPSFIPIKIKTNLSWKEVAQIELKKIDMPGVEVRQEIRRTHLFGEISAHLLGYIGEVNSSELPLLNKIEKKYRLGDQIGRFGLEQKMEDILRGEDGEEIKEVDALGREKLEKNRNDILKRSFGKEAIPGKNLILTLDQDLQQVAVKAFGEKIGSVVAIQPQTGEVLVMVSRPSFNPTTFSRGISAQIWNQLIKNENHPLRDKTIQDHYAPGSVFKVVTAIAGLEEKVIDEHTTFHCPGKLKIGNRVFHCHVKHGHGDIQLIRAIAQSCDVYFYRLAQKLKSVDDIAKWAQILGLGKKTGFPLAGEVPGLIPSEAWKKNRYHQDWTAGETASVAIGQSFLLLTTLQLANLYSTLSNGGSLFRPFVVKRIETAEGDLIQEFKPEKMGKVDCQPKTLDLVKQGLFQVLNAPFGTAYRYRIPGLEMAGKTGTVQVVRLSEERLFQSCHLLKPEDRHNAVFVTFAPVEEPKIVIAVIAKNACRSSEAAAIAQPIMIEYFKKNDPSTHSKINTKSVSSGNLLRVDLKEEEAQNENYQPAPPSPDIPLYPPFQSEPTGENP